MNSEIIASRHLMIRDEMGESRPFVVAIGRPFIIDENEYCCEIYSDNIMFNGIKKSYGMDPIDCIDYAIQLIDLLSTELPKGKILWPDGTPYNRVPTTLKMGWGKEGDDN